MKNVGLFVFCFLCTVAQIAYAGTGGEDHNTNCNGVGNPNSFCDEGHKHVNQCNPDTEEPPVVHRHVCLVPTEAVDAYLNGTSPFAFSSDAKVCTRQCKAVAQACGKVGKAQAKCHLSVLKADAKKQLAACNLDKATQKACKAQVKLFSHSYKDLVKENAAEAKAVCAAAKAACPETCEGE